MSLAFQGGCIGMQAPTPGAVESKIKGGDLSSEVF